jgi:catechol 2,3-dioxygenase-like lactoylglutathione lyase family enzyme
MKALLTLVLALAPAAAAGQAAAPVFKTSGAFIGLSVADLEASARWYADKLGLRVVLDPPAYEGVKAKVLEGGGLIVELVHNPKAVPLRTAAPAITHTTLVHGIFKAGVIVDDYEQTLAALRARGVEIAMGPFPARDGQRANVIIRDNAGNLIQVFGR